MMVEPPSFGTTVRTATSSGDREGNCLISRFRRAGPDKLKLVGIQTLCFTRGGLSPSLQKIEGGKGESPCRGSNSLEQSFSSLSRSDCAKQDRYSFPSLGATPVSLTIESGEVECLDNSKWSCAIRESHSAVENGRGAPSRPEPEIINRGTLAARAAKVPEGFVSDLGVLEMLANAGQVRLAAGCVAGEGVASVEAPRPFRLRFLFLLRGLRVSVLSWGVNAEAEAASKTAGVVRGWGSHPDRTTSTTGVVSVAPPRYKFSMLDDRFLITAKAGEEPAGAGGTGSSGDGKVVLIVASIKK